MTDEEIKDACSLNKFKEMQVDVDQIRENRKKICNDEEKNKHDAVEKALSLLSQAGVMAYIYADLPNMLHPSTIPSIYQFSTILSLCKFDEDGNQTKESMERLSIYNSFLWLTLFETITNQSNIAQHLGLDKLDRSDPKTAEKKMDFFTKFMWQCLYTANEYCKKHKDDP
jgi:hypothetical protein